MDRRLQVKLGVDAEHVRDEHREAVLPREAVAPPLREAVPDPLSEHEVREKMDDLQVKELKMLHDALDEGRLAHLLSLIARDPQHHAPRGEASKRTTSPVSFSTRKARTSPKSSKRCFTEDSAMKAARITGS